MRSPRAKTIAHLQMLIAAAAATAAACGKDKAEKQPDPNQWSSSSGYAVVDPIPTPTIEPLPPPKPSLAQAYDGKIKLTVTQRDRKATTVLYELHLVAPPELSLDDVQAPPEPLLLSKTNRPRKNEATFFILAPTHDASSPPVGIRLVARGEAGIVDVYAEWTTAGGTVKLTDAKE